MSDKSKKIKVIDRRMFTADGEIREEFKDLKDAETPSTPVAQPAAEASSVSLSGPGKAASPKLSGALVPEQEPQAEQSDDEATTSRAAFYDLVAMLAQTASVYLNQAVQELDQRAELLEMAGMHIDLLGVLKKKTRGNLSHEEGAMLDDAIYRLRTALVEVGG